MHVPVLLNETISGLNLSSNSTVVDCTIGFGGHSSEILNRYPGCKLIGIDQDSMALSACASRFGHHVQLHRGNFADLDHILDSAGINRVDGVLADLGISSYQLDASGRGFSFTRNEPLDLRLDPDGPTTAADWVHRASESQLSDAFYYYGDLIHNKRLVTEIVSVRRRGRIQTTDDLTDIVKRTFRFGSRPMMMKVLSQVYQSIRIAVNQEMAVLDRWLLSLGNLVNPGGRVAIITFHSGEDRKVKHFFQGQRDVFLPVNKKVIIASQDEIRANSRSKAAKLRIYERR